MVQDFLHPAHGVTARSYIAHVIPPRFMVTAGVQRRDARLWHAEAFSLHVLYVPPYVCL